MFWNACSSVTNLIKVATEEVLLLVASHIRLSTSEYKNHYTIQCLVLSVQSYWFLLRDKTSCFQITVDDTEGRIQKRNTQYSGDKATLQIPPPCMCNGTYLSHIRSLNLNEISLWKQILSWGLINNFVDRLFCHCPEKQLRQVSLLFKLKSEFDQNFLSWDGISFLLNYSGVCWIEAILYPHLHYGHFCILWPW